MKRHKLTILFTLLMSTVGPKAFAYDALIDGIYYYLKGTEATVTYDGHPVYSGNVVIPESVTCLGKTYSVTGIGNDSFSDCSGLTSVTIPNSVTIISGSAFNGCSGLTSVVIPNSVTSIGGSAFKGCSGLEEVNFNATNCASMGSDDYPVFSGCSSLATLKIGDNVQNIPAYAFYNCSGLTSVTIGNSVTSIGSSAFRRCSGLTSVSIPNSVTSIGGSAFEGCSGLASVTIGNSVTSIGSSAFYGTGIYNNSSEGVFFVDNWVCGYKGTMPPNTAISLVEGTRGISRSAFSGCSGLTSVAIPNSVAYIGDYAFYGCI